MTASDSDLADWMRAYQTGDREAFRHLYRFLAPRLRGYLISLSLNRTLAEDLLQETFLQMHRSRHTYRSSLPVVPWAFAIARNCFRMERRSFFRKRQPETDLIALDELPLGETFASEHRLDLREALGTLREDWRESLLLHEVWGLRFKEIGSMLGIAEGAARLRAHRALAELRKKLHPL